MELEKWEQRIKSFSYRHEDLSSYLHDSQRVRCHEAVRAYNPSITMARWRQREKNPRSLGSANLVYTVVNKRPCLKQGWE